MYKFFFGVILFAFPVFVLICFFFSFELVFWFDFPFSLRKDNGNSFVLIFLFYLFVFKFIIFCFEKKTKKQSIVALTDMYCTAERYIEGKCDLRIQKIGKHYRAFRRESVSGNWKTNTGTSFIEMIELLPRYKFWADICSESFGGMDICTVDVLVSKADGKEYILEFNGTASGFGDKEGDNYVLRDYVIKKMNQHFCPELCPEEKEDDNDDDNEADVKTEKKTDDQEEDEDKDKDNDEKKADTQPPTQNNDGKTDDKVNDDKGDDKGTKNTNNDTNNDDANDDNNDKTESTNKPDDSGDVTDAASGAAKTEPEDGFAE